MGFASCKAFGRSISASMPNCPLSPGKGILLGLPPLDPVGGLRPCDPIFKNYIGFSTNRKHPDTAGCFLFIIHRFANRRQTHHRSERVFITVILDFTSRYRLINCELDCRGHHRTEPCVAEFLCSFTNKVGS